MRISFTLRSYPCLSVNRRVVRLERWNRKAETPTSAKLHQAIIDSFSIHSFSFSQVSYCCVSRLFSEGCRTRTRCGAWSSKSYSRNRSFNSQSDRSSSQLMHGKPREPEGSGCRVDLVDLASNNIPQWTLQKISQFGSIMESFALRNKQIIPLQQIPLSITASPCLQIPPLDPTYAFLVGIRLCRPGWNGIEINQEMKPIDQK